MMYGCIPIEELIEAFVLAEIRFKKFVRLDVVGMYEG